jgi:hypothetical protein
LSNQIVLELARERRQVAVELVWHGFYSDEYIASVAVCVDKIIFQEHGKKSFGSYIGDDFVEIMVVIFIEADSSSLDVLLD